MAYHRTHGYDLVLELSDTGLNDALGGTLREIPIREGILDLPASAGGPIAFRWEVDPNASTVDLDTPLENGICLDLAFALGLELAAGDESPTGRVRIHHPLSLRAIGSTRRCASLDFSDGVPVGNLEVTFDPPLSAPLAGHEATVGEAVAEMIATHLEEEVGRLESENLCLEIDPAGTDPLVPTEVDLQVVRDDFGRCLALLFTTGGGEAGDPSAFTDCAIATRPEAQMLMMLGNDLLLQRLICPRFLTLLALTGPVDDFFEFAGAEATLRDAVPMDHLVADDRVDDVDLTSLRITIEDGRVVVVGGLSLAGTGWTCTVPLEGSVTVGVNDHGDPEVVTEVVPGTPDVRFEWWVWLLGVLGGTIILPVIGTVVVAVTLALLDDVVEESLAGALEGLFPAPDIPSPDPPGEMEIDELFLDDLAVYGRPAYSDWPPETIEPEVWISGELEVTDVQGTGTTHTSLGAATEILRTTFEKTHYGAFRAHRRLLIAPLTYRWSLDDQPLEEGIRTEVEREDGTVATCRVLGDGCEVWTEMGADLDAVLRVVVEDTHGTSIEAERRLTAEGGSQSIGVTGEEALMGPLAEIFLTTPHRVLDVLATLGELPQWGTRPDEMEEESWSRPAYIEAMRGALGRGMDMDLGDLPFHG